MFTFNYVGRSVKLSTDFLSDKDTTGSTDGKIRVTNNTGNNIAGGITVVVTVPASLTLTPATSDPSKGTFDDGTTTWTFTGLNAGATETLDLTFTIAGGWTCPDDIQVTASGTIDAGGEPVLTDNNSSATLQGYACCEIDGCIDIDTYITYGSLIDATGAGTSADPKVVNVDLAALMAAISAETLDTGSIGTH